MTDRDHYAEGWAQGIQHARAIVMEARTLDAAREALERLLMVDYKHRKRWASENRTRKGVDA